MSHSTPARNPGEIPEIPVDDQSRGNLNAAEEGLVTATHCLIDQAHDLMRINEENLSIHILHPAFIFVY
jgi:hypothetical protein